MSFFKRMLSSVGIGSAKVDTLLENDEVVPGDAVHAVVRIEAGEVEQTIDEIYLSLHSTYLAEVEVDDEEREVTRTAVLDKFKVGEPFTLQPGDTRELPVEIEIPLDTPITAGRTKVWVQTGLDIKKAVDPGDRDYLRVVPDRLVGALFTAMEELGFRLAEAKCEAGRSYAGRLPFIQEFEWKPVRGSFRGRLDEVEIVYFHRGDALEVHMEIDRKARGLGGFLAEAFELDESHIRFEVVEDDLPELTRRLKEALESWS